MSAPVSIPDLPKVLVLQATDLIPVETLSGTRAIEVQNAKKALGNSVTHINLTTNYTLANPTGTVVDGQMVMWRFKQDVTGNRTVTLGSKFRLPQTASALPWSTASNRTDILVAVYNLNDDKWDIISFIPGY